jgi:prevent-host-death family protein
MAKSFTFTQTRQNLASVLAQAEQDGEVLITKRGGKKFILRPVTSDRSPLDVPGIDIGMTRQEIVDTIREGRVMDIRGRRDADWEKKYP